MHWLSRSWLSPSENMLVKVDRPFQKFPQVDGKMKRNRWSHHRNLGHYIIIYIYIYLYKYKYIYIVMVARPCQNSLSAYLSENPGHRSGWGPHRFTWLGDRVLVLVLTCGEMPLSWSRSKPFGLSHYALLGGLRLPWPPSCLSGPHRRLCFFSQCVSYPAKKKLAARGKKHASYTPAIFWKGRAMVTSFLPEFAILSQGIRPNLAQWLERTANNRKVPGSNPGAAHMGA